MNRKIDKRWMNKKINEKLLKSVSDLVSVKVSN